MSQFLRKVLVLVLLATPIWACAEPPDKAVVLERLIASYGGEANVRKLDNMVQEWDMVALKSKRHGTDIRGLQSPDRLMVKLTYPQKVERRILNGDEGLIAFNSDRTLVASAAQRDAMRLQLMRLYSPLMLRDKADEVTLSIEGDLCALTLIEHGVQADYLVNTDSWRIEKVVGTLAIGGQSMRFRTEYSDFTVIEGVLVHQQENKFAGDVNTALLRLRDITFDVDLGGSDIFAD